MTQDPIGSGFDAVADGIDGPFGWAQPFWNMLNEGGIWAVPHSGLIFRKRGNQLTLIEQMPWEKLVPESGITKKQLLAAQKDSIEDIRYAFATIGVTLVEMEL